MRRVLAVIVCAALAAGGCARSRPKTQPAPTPLAVPSPPSRVVAPPEPEPQQTPPSPVPEAEGPQQKPARARSVQPRSEGRKVEPPSAIEPAHPAAAGPTLQQALHEAPGEVERKVRERLTRASHDLARVDYGGLGADGRAQYDTAKRFIEQAEQALKDRNLVFAEKLAEKAAGLADTLVGR